MFLGEVKHCHLQCGDFHARALGSTAGTRPPWLNEVICSFQQVSRVCQASEAAGERGLSQTALRGALGLQEGQRLWPVLPEGLGVSGGLSKASGLGVRPSGHARAHLAVQESGEGHCVVREVGEPRDAEPTPDIQEEGDM